MLCISLAVKYYYIFLVVIYYDTEVELKSTVHLIKRRRFHTNRTLTVCKPICCRVWQTMWSDLPSSDMSGFLFPLIHARLMH